MDTETEDRVLVAARALLGEEAYGCARALVSTSTEHARRTGTRRLLANLLAVRAELDLRVGQWSRARSAASEALSLCEAARDDETGAAARIVLARLDAAQGRVADCLHCLAETRCLLCERRRLVDADAVEGFLAMGLCDSCRTIDLLEPLAGRRGSSESRPEAWAPDLIEAYARDGRRSDARRLLHRFEAQARRARCRWALAAAARGAGVVTGAEEFDRHFRAGLEPSLAADIPFERARTELCYGERLRRVGRRRDSRSRLSAALTTFEELQAEPWAARARSELRASVEHTSRARTTLTPQERRVASLVARGRTNKEAATILFVTEKTIEFHLRGVFRKLGVRSRTQLAYRLGRAEAGRDSRGEWAVLGSNQ